MPACQLPDQRQQASSFICLHEVSECLGHNRWLTFSAASDNSFKAPTEAKWLISHLRWSCCVLANLVPSRPLPIPHAIAINTWQGRTGTVDETQGRRCVCWVGGRWAKQSVNVRDVEADLLAGWLAAWVREGWTGSTGCVKSQPNYNPMPQPAHPVSSQTGHLWRVILHQHTK